MIYGLQSELDVRMNVVRNDNTYPRYHPVNNNSDEDINYQPSGLAQGGFVDYAPDDGVSESYYSSIPNNAVQNDENAQKMVVRKHRLIGWVKPHKRHSYSPVGVPPDLLNANSLSFNDGSSSVELVNVLPEPMSPGSLDNSPQTLSVRHSRMHKRFSKLNQKLFAPNTPSTDAIPNHSYVDNAQLLASSGSVEETLGFAPKVRRWHRQPGADNEHLSSSSSSTNSVDGAGNSKIKHKVRHWRHHLGDRFRRTFSADAHEYESVNNEDSSDNENN